MNDQVSIRMRTSMKIKAYHSETTLNITLKHKSPTKLTNAVYKYGITKTAFIRVCSAAIGSESTI